MRVLLAVLVLSLGAIALADDGPKSPEPPTADVTPRCTDLGSPTPFMVERLYGPPISREDTLCAEGPIPYGKTFTDWRCLIGTTRTGSRSGSCVLRTYGTPGGRVRQRGLDAETLVKNSAAMVIGCSVVPGTDDTRDRMVVMCLVGMEQTRCSDVFPKLAKAVHCADEGEAARYVARNCPGPRTRGDASRRAQPVGRVSR